MGAVPKVVAKSGYSWLDNRFVGRYWWLEKGFGGQGLAVTGGWRRASGGKVWRLLVVGEGLRGARFGGYWWLEKGSGGQCLAVTGDWRRGSGGNVWRLPVVGEGLRGARFGGYWWLEKGFGGQDLAVTGGWRRGSGGKIWQLLVVGEGVRGARFGDYWWLEKGFGGQDLAVTGGWRRGSGARFGSYWWLEKGFGGQGLAVTGGWRRGSGGKIWRLLVVGEGVLLVGGGVNKVQGVGGLLGAVQFVWEILRFKLAAEFPTRNPGASARKQRILWAAVRDGARSQPSTGPGGLGGFQVNCVPLPPPSGRRVITIAQEQSPAHRTNARRAVPSPVAREALSAGREVGYAEVFQGQRTAADAGR